MPHPAAGYIHPDGTRVPSVTEVLKVLGWGQDALLRWAENQGRKGVSAADSTQDGATVGSCVHDRIEAILRGEVFQAGGWPIDVVERATPMVDQFLRWHRRVDLRVTATELQLVHPVARYGGCLDVWGVLDGREVIIDVKTTSGVYPKHILQLGGYAGLVEWHYPAEIQAGVIVRIGKKGGCQVVTVERPHLHRARELFMQLVPLARAESEVQEWIGSTLSRGGRR